jgi:hypothetical protein
MNKTMLRPRTMLTLDTLIRPWGRYLPLDRKDLSAKHTGDSVSNFFTVCVKMGLWKYKDVDANLLEDFCINLFRVVKRRHTHLWDKNKNTPLKELAYGYKPVAKDK